ncbi:TldD/PmbA family protein [Phormidesmis priestleyi ULC007]|uniref:TldD/PmbA family protein n=1 Tax=Phormidesmis priestleyi ULC007 TaxID=1920490 RepID=A0A2T1DAW6_9CYAN|nr:TldD/PmbA family protein [Phormidesmis priestleyi]PSB17616.1 TldD/PmbA family protein [Phormidesmis priestleyi ULC007]PZO48493.1 MAG: TldD/PmbA family protein [Phormidesmis priestleyi]
MTKTVSFLESSFDQLVETIADQLKPDEHFTLSLNSEQSQFTRFNHAKVRQTGSVNDGSLSLTLMRDQRSSDHQFPFTGDLEIDRPRAKTALEALRKDVSQLPVNPYLVLPSGNATSQEIYTGQLLTIDEVVPTLLPVVADLDFTGLYAAGLMIRAYADSVGQKHWFATESFSLDYSLFTPDGQAVKGTFAGDRWDQSAYATKIQTSRQQLDRLSQPPKSISRGSYRTYLAPAAIAELVYMLSWGGVSESSFQQGGSCLGAMRRGEKKLSPKFTLRENFRHGLVPRFNELGEVAPLDLSIVEEGELVNMLISSQTAKEYKLVANGADQGETLRSPEIAPGELSSEQILATLGTGLYLSNLHYLNWSDRPTGRITGMTRYACFWVEEGEIVAPIENLRFDDSFYQFWGENLAALTNFQEFIPDVGTYENRNLGGTWVPGMIVNDFTYTL